MIYGARRMPGTHWGCDVPGQGSSVQILHKQNINVKRYTEGKMNDVESTMAKIIWSRYFVEVQGYKISHNRIIQ